MAGVGRVGIVLRDHNEGHPSSLAASRDAVLPGHAQKEGAAPRSGQCRGARSAVLSCSFDLTPHVLRDSAVGLLVSLPGFGFHIM